VDIEHVRLDAQSGRTVLHSPGNQASWKAHGCLAQPLEVISFLFHGMRRHIHTCVYMCILMYVCGEYVAHLYMIVLVMNDQTKLKLLCFSRANGRWPTVDRQKYRTTWLPPCPPASMLALQCTMKCIVKCVAPLNRTIINRPTPHTPASMLWKLLQAF